MPLPFFPWWGLLFELVVGSLPFLAAGCWFLWGWVGVFLWCCVCLWRGRCSCFRVFGVFVAPVLVAAVVVVVVCAVVVFGCVCGVSVVCLVACPHLSGPGFAALCGCGVCVMWSLASLG